MSEKIETSEEFGEMGEIDLTVFFDYQPAERMERDYPGCSESAELESVIANINNNKIDILPLIVDTPLASRLESECLSSIHGAAEDDAYERYCEDRDDEGVVYKDKY